MNVVKAILIKRKTDDNLMELEDSVELGKIYYIDIDTIQEVEGFNFIVNESWKRRMVIDVLTGDWFPVELLNIEKEEGIGREVKLNES